MQSSCVALVMYDLCSRKSLNIQVFTPLSLSNHYLCLINLVFEVDYRLRFYKLKSLLIRVLARFWSKLIKQRMAEVNTYGL